MRLNLVRILLVLWFVVGLGDGSLWSQGATATLTIHGSEQATNGVWPSGVLSITVNGQTETTSYGQFSTPGSLAAGFAAKFSSDPQAAVPNLCTLGLCAKADGAQIVFQAEGQISANLQSAGFSSSPFTLDSSEWPPLTIGPSTEPQILVPRDGLVVTLVNMASQLCLDDAGGANNPGDSAQQWTCNGLSPQKWQLHDKGNGFWSLQNQNSQLCLDDPSGSTTSGTLLQQWTCNDLSPQNWRFTNVGNGYYTVQNQAATLMLDDPGASPSPGVQLQLWYANGQPAQSWAMRDAGSNLGSLFLSCSPSTITLGSATSCTVTAPAASIGPVQFSVDDIPWTAGTLANDSVTASGALTGVGPGSHLIVARTNQAGTILTATTTVVVLPNNSSPPTVVYGYSIMAPQGVSGYAPNGDILAYADSVNGSWQDMKYDSLNRIVSAAQGPLSSSSPTGYDCWAYDSFGNRTVQAYSDQPPTGGTCASAGVATVYLASSSTFDGANRVNGRAAATLSGTISQPALLYDSAGNTTGDPVTNYSYLYDGQGRLCATQTSVGMTGYLYDADGHRVAKGTLSTMSCDPTLVVNGQLNFSVTTMYMLGPNGETMTEIDGGTWTKTHVYAGGEEIATYDSNGIHFQIDDWLGTRRVQTNAFGILESSFASQPFGDCLLSATCPTAVQDASNQHFTGKERDQESGLDYFGARYYASNMGRWMSPDWADKPEAVPYSSLDNPQSLNLYGYVGNNPLSRADSDGHEECCEKQKAWAGDVAKSFYNNFAGMAEDFINMPVPDAPMMLDTQVSLPRGQVSSTSANVVGTALSMAVPIGGEEAGATRGANILENAAKGKAFQEGVAAAKSLTNPTVVQNIMVKTESGIRTVIDVATKDASEAIGLTEAKSSAGARLTPAQAAGHPEIANSGATVVGRGKPGFPGGTRIPPTKVDVVRPPQ